MNIIRDNAWGAVVVGLLVGVVGYHAVLSIAGLTLVDQQKLEQRQQILLQLQEENRQLSDELFGPRELPGLPPEDLVRPYDENADARADVMAAQVKALEERKFLMVTFGANWCQDCRTLYTRLESDEVTAYAKGRFEFANVDVGKFNRNIELAAELGANLERGIPVAVFFDADGGLIGATNDGELEPARLYTSNQILKFVKDVAERSRILAPDAVR